MLGVCRSYGRRYLKCSQSSTSDAAAQTWRSRGRHNTGVGHRAGPGQAQVRDVQRAQKPRTRSDGDECLVRAEGDGGHRRPDDPAGLARSTIEEVIGPRCRCEHRQRVGRNRRCRDGVPHGMKASGIGVDLCRPHASPKAGPFRGAIDSRLAPVGCEGRADPRASRAHHPKRAFAVVTCMRSQSWHADQALQCSRTILQITKVAGTHQPLHPTTAAVGRRCRPGVVASYWPMHSMTARGETERVMSFHRGASPGKRLDHVQCPNNCNRLSTGYERKALHTKPVVLPEPDSCASAAARFVRSQIHAVRG